MTEHSVESLRSEAEAAETEDFDQFWSAQNRRGVRLSNVFGVDVELPPEMPLRYEIEARRAARSSSTEDIRRMVGLLFGDDALDRWIEAGMDDEQFGVLLLWGSVNVSGDRITLAEARRRYHAKNSGEREQGKAPGKPRNKNRNRKKRGGSSNKGGR